jgi:hypothetical protein
VQKNIQSQSKRIKSSRLAPLREVEEGKKTPQPMLKRKPSADLSRNESVNNVNLAATGTINLNRTGNIGVNTLRKTNIRTNLKMTSAKRTIID